MSLNNSKGVTAGPSVRPTQTRTGQPVPTAGPAARRGFRPGLGRPLPPTCCRGPSDPCVCLPDSDSKTRRGPQAQSRPALCRLPEPRLRTHASRSHACPCSQTPHARSAPRRRGPHTCRLPGRRSLHPGDGGAGAGAGPGARGRKENPQTAAEALPGAGPQPSPADFGQHPRPLLAGGR